MLKSVVLMSFLLSAMCFAQTEIVTDSAKITLCWDGTTDTSAIYQIGYKYMNGDTAFKYLGSTKEKQFVVDKGEMRNKMQFLVRSILPAKSPYFPAETTSYHSSLDVTACVSGDACGATCTTQGSWYMFWKHVKPKKLSKK